MSSSHMSSSRLPRYSAPTSTPSKLKHEHFMVLNKRAEELLLLHSDPRTISGFHQFLVSIFMKLDVSRSGKWRGFRSA